MILKRPRIRECIECHEVRRIQAHNLCGTCYSRWREQRKKLKKCTTCHELRKVTTRGECYSCDNKRRYRENEEFRESVKAKARVSYEERKDDPEYKERRRKYDRARRRRKRAEKETPTIECPKCHEDVPLPLEVSLSDQKFYYKMLQREDAPDFRPGITNGKKVTNNRKVAP
jgi:hypothetical protein